MKIRISNRPNEPNWRDMGEAHAPGLPDGERHSRYIRKEDKALAGFYFATKGHRPYMDNTRGE